MGLIHHGLLTGYHHHHHHHTPIHSPFLSSSRMFSALMFEICPVSYVQYALLG